FFINGIGHNAKQLRAGCAVSLKGQNVDFDKAWVGAYRLHIDHTAICRTRMEVIGATWTGYGKPFKSVLDSFQERVIVLHNLRHRRCGIGVSLLYDKALYIVSGTKVLQIITPGERQQDATHALVDALP